jgi:hypothetical protein
MARGVSLVREEIARAFVKNRGDAFRLRITAVDNVLMPKHIFMHQRRLVDPIDATTGDEFVCIASPFDATIYPASEPDLAQFPQFFRKDVVDILVPSTEAAQEVWDAIHAQVCILVAAYNRLDSLVEVETTRCGDAIENSVSESGSESASL